MKILSGKLSRAHSTDAGSDIHSVERVLIPAGDSRIISTNLKVKLDPNTFGLVKSRSGLSFKYNLEAKEALDEEIGAGVIDEGYDGEIKVHMYNHGFDPYQVNIDDKIAQIIILPVIYPDFSDKDNTRGGSGFGSSGK